MEKLGRGYFVTVQKSEKEGKVEKRFRFPLLENTAKNLKETHDRYVSLAGRAVDIPETTMEAQRLQDGTYQMTILQDDLSLDGSSLADFLKGHSDQDCLKAFALALEGTFSVYRYSKTLEKEGIALRLESNPSNWWVKGNGQMTFFDTTPPLLSTNNKIDKDILVPKENPTFIGRLTAWLARAPLIRLLSDMVIRRYAFDWPTTIRTFLVKTIDCAPQLKEKFIKATRSAVDMLDDKARFQKRLTDMSIRIELLKLRMFNWLSGIGEKK